MTNGFGFGGVADLYDEVRPGDPATLGERLLDFHGGRPRDVVEPAASPGKATELLVTLGAPVTCIEPDPRMASILRAKFPNVPVVLVQTFSPFRRHSPARQAAVLESVNAAVNGLGGSVVLDLRTTLVLARA